MSPDGERFQRFMNENFVILTTFRKDGRSVATTINIAVNGDHAYFRTTMDTGKIKRIRNNPRVTIAPGTRQGAITGSSMDADARLLSGEESSRASGVLIRKYPIIHRFVPILQRLSRKQSVMVELTATS